MTLAQAINNIGSIVIYAGDILGGNYTHVKILHVSDRYVAIHIPGVDTKLVYPEDLHISLIVEDM